jgi:hypothetical protein
LLALAAAARALTALARHRRWRAGSVMRSEKAAHQRIAGGAGASARLAGIWRRLARRRQYGGSGMAAATCIGENIIRREMKKKKIQSKALRKC